MSDFADMILDETRCAMDEVTLLFGESPRCDYHVVHKVTGQRVGPCTALEGQRIIDQEPGQWDFERPIGASCNSRSTAE